MPSRRKLLAALSSAVVAGMAGCSGSGSSGSDTLDCQTNALEHGDGDVLDGGAMARVENDIVRLIVPLSVDDAREQNLDRLDVFDPADNLAFTIPVSTGDADLMANKDGVGEGQLQYEQSLGHRPFHSRYRFEAVTTSGESIDFVTVEFNCFADVSS